MGVSLNTRSNCAVHFLWENDHNALYVHINFVVCKVLSHVLFHLFLPRTSEGKWGQVLSAILSDEKKKIQKG